MKIFYGWRMVAAGGAIQFLQAGLLQQAFGVYVAVLSHDQGWSKTALSGGAAIQSVEGALLGPALGWFIDRFGPQAMIRLGILLFGAGFILLGQVETLTGFYVAVAVIAIGSSLSGHFPLTVALIHWFRKQRARALSALSLGFALGGIAVPIVAWAMQMHGWRATATGSGVIALLAGWPLATVMRRRPELHGEFVDGVPPAKQSHHRTAQEDQGSREFTAHEALRTRAFWLLAVGHSCQRPA